jgi:hypothetical protein
LHLDLRKMVNWADKEDVDDLRRRGLRLRDWLEYRDDAADWCQGKSWLWRGALLLYLLYAGVRQLFDPQYGSVFSAITFGLHELGHVLFSPCGEFLMVLGGSATQVLAPLITAILFLRQREYFGLSVAGSWLCFSLYNLALYVGDARAMNLPLLGLSDDPVHDWNYLLTCMGWLAWDQWLAQILRLTGAAVWLASMLWGAWLLAQMFLCASELPE